MSNCYTLRYYWILVKLSDSYVMYETAKLTEEYHFKVVLVASSQKDTTAAQQTNSKYHHNHRTHDITVFYLMLLHACHTKFTLVLIFFFFWLFLQYENTMHQTTVIKEYNAVKKLKKSHTSVLHYIELPSSMQSGGLLNV